MKLSFVIPCYHSQDTIAAVVSEINETMKTLFQYTYEIILVNDCSSDDTLKVIRSIAKEQKHVKGINLSKNFGQHAALMAGFHYATGDYIVCLDDDGQTPANEVERMLEPLHHGSDVVYAQYDHKKHSIFRNLGSKINDLMTRFLLNKPKDLYLSSYFVMKRFVMDEMLHYENSYPYVIGLVLRSTKKITNVSVNHRQRDEGKSGYTMKKLLSLWFNGFTSFSIKPLRIATVIGTICAGLGFAYGIYTIIKKFVNPEVILGFSSLMSALMFIGGMLMLMLGLIGEYIGRIYISINNSPQFVVSEVITNENCEKHEN